jgi:transposase
VEQGPDPEPDGVVHCHIVELRERIKKEFTVELDESTISKMLRRLNFTRLQPRPYHPKKDAAAQEAFEKISPAW